MANEPVFVPIELDIDIDLKNIKTAHADLTKKLKSLTASMNDILSKVDSSKLGTNLSKALNNLARDYNTVITAQQRYVKSVKRTFPMLPMPQCTSRLAEISKQTYGV